MAGSKNKKYFQKAVDFFYSLSLFVALWVWMETGNLWLTGLTLLGSLGLLYLGITKYKQRKRRILLESGIDTIDSMSGAAFEEYVLERFRHLGYTGHLTPAGDDNGADMLLQKDGTTTVVQAKRWKNSVGIDAIRQVKGAMDHYAAAHGIVVTNSTFTESACELASSYEIELWDRKKLIELMNKVKGKEHYHENNIQQTGS